MVYERDGWPECSAGSLLFSCEVPGYIKYLSTCAWLQGWPWRKFLDNPGQCYTHYFRRRQVIVADSEASDYIYVVRHGSCQVLMLIDALKGSWKDVEDTVLKEFFLLNQRMGMSGGCC